MRASQTNTMLGMGVVSLAVIGFVTPIEAGHEKATHQQSHLEVKAEVVGARAQHQTRVGQAAVTRANTLTGLNADLRAGRIDAATYRTRADAAKTTYQTTRESSQVQRNDDIRTSVKTHLDAMGRLGVPKPLRNAPHLPPGMKDKRFTP